VDFYYIYKALSHPGHNRYVMPFTLDERLMHAREAERTLGSRIPWLVDNMDDAAHTAFGTLSNVELVVDVDARIVRRRMWSDPEGLRLDLDELVGPAAQPTRVEDLDMQQLPPPPTVATGIVPPVELPGRMWPLVAEPVLGESRVPFFVKLRADGDADLINTGRGTLYLGFFLDPLYEVHWNNEAPPLKFEIQPPEGVEIAPASMTGPQVQEPADGDPREFLVNVAAQRTEEPLALTFDYYACDNDLTFCIPVKQRYRIGLQRDISHGWTFRPGGARQ